MRSVKPDDEAVMGDAKNSKSSDGNLVQILVATIGVAGVLGAALLSNWDKVFTKHEPPAQQNEGHTGTGHNSDVIANAPNKEPHDTDKQVGSPDKPPTDAQPSGQFVQLSREEVERSLVRKVEPAYPPLARQRQVQGQVVLQVMINDDGTVESARVISGHPMLVPAAIEAVKQWKYKPYRLNGAPSGVKSEVTVSFKLD